MNVRRFRWNVLVGAACWLISVNVSYAAPPLLLRYSFDELAGQAIDLGVAPAADGSFFGDATRTTNTPGRFSRAALDLNGISTDFVSAGDTDKLDGLTSYSMTLWLNLRDTYLGTGRILGKHDLSSTGFDLVAAPSNASGFTTMSASEFSLQLLHESGSASSTVDIDAENRWVFMGMTYDGGNATDNLRFYTGDESAVVSTLGVPLDHNGGTAMNNTIDFTIGGAGPVVADLTLPGRYDDVRIYDGVLRQSSLELIRLSNLTHVPTGDFNNDLIFNCHDVDLLTMQIASGSGNLMHLFDMTQDGVLNGDDLDAWLGIAGGANLPSGEAYQYGDANLDGTVDGLDFVIWNAHKFTNSARWCAGDFTANGTIDGEDFLRWNANKFISASAVPEPSVFLGVLVMAICVGRFAAPRNR